MSEKVKGEYETVFGGNHGTEFQVKTLKCVMPCFVYPIQYIRGLQRQTTGDVYEWECVYFCENMYCTV